MRFLMRNHIHNAMESFRANRSRALLTSFGIAVGMACIVMILSISGGLKTMIRAQVSGENSNILVVRPEANRTANDKSLLSLIGTSQTYASSSLTREDAEAIAEVENVVSTAPIAIFESNLTAKGESKTGQIVASTAELENIVSLPLSDGSFISDDYDYNQIVLGYRLSELLFDDIDTVGETVKIKDEVFLVTGVVDLLDTPINYNDVDFDQVAIISLNRAEKINEHLQIQQINVQVSSQAAIDPVSSAINDLLTERHSGDQDFSVVNGGEMSGSTKRLFDIITTVLGLVAGVSLIVGGIGVMNIMLVSVSERTHEIGIRKSVGASNGNILMQFLFESLILSLTGGLLGLAFGYAFAFGVSHMLPFEPEVSWEIIGVTIGISVAVSCIFGIVPAMRAARKDPIDSLRYYR